MQADHTDEPAGCDDAMVYVAFELSKSKWQLGVRTPGAEKMSRYREIRRRHTAHLFVPILLPSTDGPPPPDHFGPGFPHHVIQRGNRREPVFFEDGGQEAYRDLLAEQTFKRDVDWAYCLMPNHLHLILAPSDATGLRRAVGEAHRRTTSFINARGRWTGHLFQSRFSSVAMDESHLIAAVRHVILNPVQARLARKTERDWASSSVRAHLTIKDDEWVSVAPVRTLVDRFAALFEIPFGRCSLPRASVVGVQAIARLEMCRLHRRPRTFAGSGQSPDARPGESQERNRGAVGSG